MFLGAQKNRLIKTVLLSTHNMFWLRNKKNNFQVRTLIWRPGLMFIIRMSLIFCTFYLDVLKLLFLHR